MSRYDVGMRQVHFINVESTGLDEAHPSRKQIHRDKCEAAHKRR